MRYAPFRGFDHFVGVAHDQTPENGHYAMWMKRYYPEYMEGELYDRVNDPGKLVNLWDDPAHQAVKEELVAKIDNELLARPLNHPLPEPGGLI